MPVAVNVPPTNISLATLAPPATTKLPMPISVESVVAFTASDCNAVEPVTTKSLKLPVPVTTGSTTVIVPLGVPSASP